MQTPAWISLGPAACHACQRPLYVLAEKKCPGPSQSHVLVILTVIDSMGAYCHGYNASNLGSHQLNNALCMLGLHQDMLKQKIEATLAE